MIANPLATLPAWLSQGPKSVVLHVESFTADADVLRAIEMARNASVHPILASRNDTPLARLLSFVPRADGVQCMGIAEIGRQGNPFDVRVLARIRAMREKHPDLSISVDGGVNADTITSLKAAGANRFVAGSAIFSAPNPAQVYAKLSTLVSGD